MKKQPFLTYQSLCTQFYDLEFASRTSKSNAHIIQKNFFLNAAAMAQGPILEPMCGTGRLMLPLLEAGFDIEGFDASPFMLQAFTQKYAKFSDKKPPIQQALIQKFVSNKKYGLIFIPFGSLGLITDTQELKKSLQNMYSLLASGGTFIIEIDTIASLPQELGILYRGSHKTENGSMITLSTIESYNPTTQIMDAECTYQLIHHGTIQKTEFEPFYQYLYNQNEMDGYLQEAGFVITNKYKNYEEEPITDKKSDVIIYICRK